MTKYHYLLTFYFFFFGLVSVNAQGCIGGSQYPLSTITPTTTWSNIATIEKSHEAWKIKMAEHPTIKNVRCVGTIVACELETVEKDGYLNPIRGKAYDHFIKKGILLRPLGNTLYI
jgi:adenosylmethionine-8-amino-7-oxononanoate aminotransferase